MAIEIKELVIKASVVKETETEESVSKKDIKKMKKEIMDSCIEQLKDLIELEMQR